MKGDVLATVQNLQFNAEQGEAQQPVGRPGGLVPRRRSPQRRAGLPAELEKNAPTSSASSSAPVADPPPGARDHPRDPRPPARPAPAGAGRGPRPPPGHRRSDRPGLVRPSPSREKLAAANAGARADLLAAQQRYTSQKGELETTRIAIGRIQAAGRGPGPAVGDPRPLPHRDQQGAQRGRSCAAQLAEQLTGRNDKVARRELRARWTASSTAC